MNKRKIGNKYEIIAKNYLLSNGYKILRQNFYYKGGEIDLIAAKGKSLYFVEVKYRKNSNFGYAIESISNKKLLNIYKGINLFLNNCEFFFDTIHISAITFDKNKMEYIDIV